MTESSIATTNNNLVYLYTEIKDLKNQMIGTWYMKFNLWV